MKNKTKPEGEKSLAEPAKIPTVSKVALQGLDRLLREAERTRLKAEIDDLEKERDKIDWRSCNCKWRDYLDQGAVIDAKKFTVRELARGEEKYSKIRRSEKSLSSEIERLQGLPSWSAEDRSNAALFVAIGGCVRRRDDSGFNGSPPGVH